MGRFVTRPKKWEHLLENKIVEKWFKRLAGEGTKESYMLALNKFLEQTELTPEQFIALQPNEARDIVWKIVEDLSNKELGRSAQIFSAAMRHFYRYHTERKLEFDSRRGGKHYIPIRRKKVSYEMIPDRKQMYAIADSMGNWRNKAMVLTLFQSGIRINALYHLNYGHVADQLNHVPIRLRITPDIDTKLRGMDLDYYYSFIGKEGVEALNRYFKAMQTQGVKFEKDTPLFMTTTGKRVTETDIWQMFKRAVKQAGLDPKGIWLHCLRKAFRKVLNASSMDEDTKEAIMGHKLPGARGNYFDLHDIDEIERKYMACNFSRVEALGMDEWQVKREAATRALRVIGLDPDEMLKLQPSITTVEEQVKFFDEKLREIMLAKREELGPTYESTVIKEKDLPAFLKKGWEFAGTLNKEKVVIKRRLGTGSST